MNYRRLYIKNTKIFITAVTSKRRHILINNIEILSPSAVGIIGQIKAPKINRAKILFDAALYSGAGIMPVKNISKSFTCACAFMNHNYRFMLLHVCNIIKAKNLNWRYYAGKQCAGSIFIN